MTKYSNINLEIGKLPPSAIELEKSVLGAIMIDKDALLEVIDIITPESFYKDEHQKIFKSIIELSQDNKDIDILTVTEKLRSSKELDEIGGALYITNLTTNITSAGHIVNHAKIVQQKFIQREVIRMSGNLNNCAFDESTELQDLIDHFNQSVDNINELSSGKTQSQHINRILDDVLIQFEKREKLCKEGKAIGISTPLKALNDLLGGWRNGDMITIAAKPSMGKTAFSLAIAKKAASTGIPVLIYNLEMSAPLLIERYIYSEAELDDQEIYKIGHGMMNDNIWIKVKQARQRLGKLPIYIDDNSYVNMNYIKAHARKMKKRNLCGMIIVDYLQLVDSVVGKWNINREREVSLMSRSAKQIAKQLNIPFILLSQLNRSLDTRGGDKRPHLSDLKESGAIEADSDIVLFIYRPEYYDIKVDKEGNSTEGVGELIIRKNRNGGIGTVKFNYNKSMTKISDAEEPKKAVKPKEKTCLLYTSPSPRD